MIAATDWLPTIDPAFGKAAGLIVVMVAINLFVLAASWAMHKAGWNEQHADGNTDAVREPEIAHQSPPDDGAETEHAY